MNAPTVARGVPAGPITRRLQALVDQGATVRWIAAQSKVTEKTVRSLLRGEREAVYRGTADALMAVPGRVPQPLRAADPNELIEMIHQLNANGWTTERLARAAGLKPSTLRPSNLRRGVTVSTRVRIVRLWDVLKDRPGPSPRPRRYPFLSQDLQQWPVDRVVAETGVGRSTVTRARQGEPLQRESAEKLIRWVASHRQDAIIREERRSAA